jgi:3-phenylpropionate/trans-cinnamate dioxygenase ferredoxin reductase subunit
MADAPDGPVERVVVIGGGVGGARAVAALREHVFGGQVTLVCGEAHRPYDRPPLSKEFLIDGPAIGTVALHPEDYYLEAGIAVRRGIRAIAIDRAACEVRLKGGERVAYDRLILATGGIARRLDFPGADLPGVMVLRTLEDATALHAMLARGSRVAIVGGGFIGLEVAAAARSHGNPVTVIEIADRLVGRTATPAVSAALARLHRANGVDVRCGARIEAAGGDSVLDHVMLAGGERLPCDLMVMGVGLAPDLSLATDCGLPVADGVLTDPEGRTADPKIFAIGDVACAANPALGASVRLESWESARLQADAAARAICNVPQRRHELPWAWSNQYDRTLQVLGVPAPDQRLVVRAGSEQDEVIEFGLVGDRIVQIAALGRAGDFATARRLANMRIPVTARALADADTPLRSLLRSPVIA